MKRLTSVLASAFAVILLFGCTANEQAGQETKKKAKETAGEQVLRLNNENEPTSFDPPIGFNNVSWQALNNLMEGLTSLAQTMSPKRRPPKSGTFPTTGRHILFYNP